MTTDTTVIFNRFRQDDIDAAKTAKAKKEKSAKVLVRMSNNGKQMHIKFPDGIQVKMKPVTTKKTKLKGTVKTKDGVIKLNGNPEADKIMQAMHISVISDDKGFSVFRQYPNDASKPNEDVSVFKHGAKELTVNYTSYQDETFQQHGKKLALA